MKLEYLLAGLLSFGPNNGYELKRILDREWRFFRKTVHLSQLYRTLNVMEKQSWVTSVVTVRVKSPDLRIYTLTDEGFKMLKDWLSTDQSEGGFRFQDRTFVSKIYFMGILDDPEIIIKQLENELGFRLDQIEKHRDRERHLEVLDDRFNIAADGMRFFSDLVHNYGTGAMDQYIDWLATTIAEIRRRYSCSD